MFLPQLCTLLSVFLLCKLPSIHVGAVKQPVQSRVLKGGILKSVEEAWDDTARVSKDSVETRCRKPSRRLQSKNGKGGKGSKKGGTGYTGNSVQNSSGSSKGMNMNKNSDSKSSKGSVPYCDDDLSQNGVTTPSPTPATNNSEDAPTNGGPSAPSPTPADDGIPTNGVPSAPSPTPADSILRDCNAIALGTARTDGGKSQSFAVNANLIVDGTVPLATILFEIQRVLQQEVAPALAGCLSNVRRRRLQETNMFNVLFGAPEAIADDQCTSALADTEANANLSCLETMIGTTVYYQGNDPLGFLEALRAAISARGNFGIDGLLGILGPQVTLVGTDDGTGTGTDGDGTGTGTNGDGTGTGTNGDGTGTGTNGDGTGTGTTGDGTGTTGDGTGNTGDGTGTGANGNDNVVAGAEAPEDPSINRGNDGVSVGTTVGVTAAGLALALLVLLLAGRRRRHAKEEKVEEGASMHRQFTDEEDDDDSYTRDMDAGAYDKNIAHVVSDEDDSVVIRWGETGDQPIYSEPIESILAADDMKFAMENHSCSSPSCKICAKKAEEGVGVRFIATPRSSNVPAPLSRDSRSYLSNDTVDL